jgi:hypothetical protein
MKGRIMQLRDTLMDTAHFERYLEKNGAEIERDERESEGLTDRRSIFGYHVSLNTLYYDKLNAMYSIGCPIAEIKPVYSTWLKHKRGAAWSVSGPGYPLYCLALGALVGFSEEDRVLVQEVIDIVEDKDPFVVFVAEAFGFHDTCKKPNKSWWSYYLKMRDMQTNEEREECLGTYLRRSWYNSNRAEYWYGFHKEPETEHYFGYWAFDIAVCAKAFGLDDSSFCDHKYYPRDLAHYLD